jgi:hypothetical protein
MSSSGRISTVPVRKTKIKEEAKLKADYRSPEYRHAGQKKIRRIHHTSLPVLIVKPERRWYKIARCFFVMKKASGLISGRGACRVRSKASNEEGGI